MKLNFNDLFEILFPASEDEKLVLSCTTADFLKKYAPQSNAGIISLLSFRDPTVRAAIHLNKFHNHAHAQTLLAQALHRWLARHADVSYLIIPIPLSPKRLRTRGYNQVSVLIPHAIKEFQSHNYDESILSKVVEKEPQTSLTREKRLENIRGAYEVTPNRSHIVAEKHILLLDDVATTGATLNEAKATLLPHTPASITCLALAH